MGEEGSVFDLQGLAEFSKDVVLAVDGLSAELAAAFEQFGLFLVQRIFVRDPVFSLDRHAFGVTAIHLILIGDAFQSAVKVAVGSLGDDRIVKHGAVEREEGTLKHQPLLVSCCNGVLSFVDHGYLAVGELALLLCERLQGNKDGGIDLVSGLSGHIAVEGEDYLPVCFGYGLCGEIFGIFQFLLCFSLCLLGLLRLDLCRVYSRGFPCVLGHASQGQEGQQRYDDFFHNPMFVYIIAKLRNNVVLQSRGVGFNVCLV